MDTSTIPLGIITLAIGAFLVVLGILWTILPFVVWNIRKTLREMLVELKHLNAGIVSLRKEIGGRG